jgi:hypothetical protein
VCLAQLQIPSFGRGTRLGLLISSGKRSISPLQSPTDRLAATLLFRLGGSGGGVCEGNEETGLSHPRPHLESRSENHLSLGRRLEGLMAAGDDSAAVMAELARRQNEDDGGVDPHGSDVPNACEGLPLRPFPSFEQQPCRSGASD